MTSTVDLILQTRQTRSGRQPKIPKPPREPAPVDLERKYKAEIDRIIGPAKTLVESLLVPQLERVSRMAGIGMQRDSATLDAEPWADVIASIMADVRSQYDAATATEIESAVSTFGAQTDQHNALTNRRQMKAMLGVDVWAEVPNVGPMLQAWAKDNVDLITSIPESYFANVEGMVLRSFNAGTRAEDLQREILPKLAEKSTSRAALIARDQISKLTGDLTRQRQLGLGVKSYIWRTSQDERVRASHARLNGKPFAWNKPPITNSAGDRNHPGGDYQCRCTAEPVIGDLLDDETGETETPQFGSAIRKGAKNSAELWIRKPGDKMRPIRTTAQSDNPEGRKRLEALNRRIANGDTLIHTLPDGRIIETPKSLPWISEKTTKSGKAWQTHRTREAAERSASTVRVAKAQSMPDLIAKARRGN